MSGRTLNSWTLDDPGLPPGPVTYHQEPGTRNQELGPPTPYPAPLVPGGKTESPLVVSQEEPPVLELALDLYRDGKLEPVELELGELPERAGPAMKFIAEHMRLLMGLRRAMGDDRPLPYATSYPVRTGHIPDKGTASKAIRRLVALGVVAHVGSLPPLRPGLDGTKLYAPPGDQT